MENYPRCALVMEPNDLVRADIYAALESLTIQASGASTLQQATQLLSLGFELMLVNADVPDALTLVEAAYTLRQPPIVLITGSTPDPRCVFGLAKAGAHAYLVAPVSAGTIHACLSGLSMSKQLLELVRPLVGHLGMKEIQARVRRAILLEALARSNGSRRSAAQLLGVTRPAVQKWLRSLAPLS